MKKGCGCASFILAVALGLALGTIGLGVVGYFWVDQKVLSKEAAAIEPLKWSKLDEAGLSVKLAPAALSIREGKEVEHKLKLKPREADRLIDRYMIANSEEIQLRLAFGDTATVIKFSVLAYEDRYVNGELRADIKAEDGDFEVTAYSLKTGEFEWPGQAMPHVSKWLEGTLETQTLFKDDPWRLMDYQTGKGDLKIKVKIVPGAGDL